MQIFIFLLLHYQTLNFTAMKINSKNFKARLPFWISFYRAWYFRSFNCTFYKVGYRYVDGTRETTYLTERCFPATVTHATFSLYTDESWSIELKQYHFFVSQLNSSQLNTFLSAVEASIVGSPLHYSFKEFLRLIECMVGVNLLRQTSYFSML